ncbi:heparinase II/III-family protein, partial [bacterium]|nr:heparinase II/III-family protein [bacterium]
VAEALYTKAVQEVFKEYVRDNWVSSNTSNWICDVTAGSILCSVALMGDYPPEDLEPYLSGSILKVGELARDAFGPDGAYGEGTLYYIHTLHGLTKSMAVLDRMFDVHFPEKIAKSHYFLLYQMDPGTKRICDFGDAFENLMMFNSSSYLSLANCAYLLGKYRDPYLKWLYGFNPGTTERDLLFGDETIVAKSPGDLPPVAHFRDIGTTVFRSGFGHDDFMFVFRCGPFVNHQHFDQGAFFLNDRGENFLGEAGRTDYYADLWYQKLVIQPGGHNCILADGNPESQRAGDFLRDVPAWKNYAFTTDFITFDGGAFVSGRLDPIYKGKFTSLRRSVLYLSPRTVVLIDEAVGAPGTGTVELRFHAPMMEDISVSGRDAFIRRPSGTLAVRTLCPGNISAEIVRRPMTLNEMSDKSAANMKARGFLRLSADLGQDGGAATVVTVMTTDRAVMDGLNDRTAPDHAVLSAGETGFFINTARGGMYTEGSVTTDALVIAAGPKETIAMRATMVDLQGEMFLRADKPVSVVYRRDGVVKTLSCSAFEPTRITMALDSKPGRVLLNGVPFKGWKYSKKDGVVIELPAGESVIGIK